MYLPQMKPALLLLLRVMNANPHSGPVYRGIPVKFYQWRSKHNSKSIDIRMFRVTLYVSMQQVICCDGSYNTITSF